MFPLDLLAAGGRGPHTAGRLGVDVLFLLAPVGDAVGTEVALVPLAALVQPAALDTLFAGGKARISRALLRDHAMVLRVRGSFLSTDRIALEQIEARTDRWSMTVTVTHVENPNLDPAPRDLYVVLALQSADNLPSRITLHFEGRERDVMGVERPLASPVAPSRVVEFD